MQVEFRILGIKADDRLRGQLTADLQALNHLMPIAHAQLSLEHQHEATPAFQAVAMLAVPGPDIHAAARDHTWPAAWRKVVARLREQMEQRRSRQIARQKGQPPIHNPAGRRAK
jgi:ribosome-associated translation inhibitor RaiA